MQCDYVAAQAARLAWEEGTRAIVLPTVPFGVNTGQHDIKLDLNMNPSTQAAVLRDIVDVLARQGIPRLVIMNGHGGNHFKQIIREVQAAHRRPFLCTLNWYEAVDWNDFFDDPGDHAGEMETSAMLHIAPHLVRPLDEAGPGIARRFKVQALREGWVWAERAWSQVTDDTGAGNPARATSQKGAAYLEAVTRRIAGFLTEFAACDLDDLYE